MGCIYKITNQLNGLRYIGQTIEIEKRWKAHKIAGVTLKRYGGKSLHFAMNKHGVENFTFEIVEECSLEIMDDRERYWIKELNTNVLVGGIGYNLTEGGKGAGNWREACSRAQRGERSAWWGKHHTEETKQKMREAHVGRSHVGWRKTPHTEQERHNKSVAADAQKVRIEQWSTTGSFLELHDSQSAAHSWMLDRGLVAENTRLITVKHGEVKLYRGFYWRRQGDKTPVPTVPTHKHWQAVEQLTSMGRSIKMFPSVKHAVLGLQQQGIKAHKNGINACLKDAEQETYGFKWRIAQFS